MKAVISDGARCSAENSATSMLASLRAAHLAVAELVADLDLADTRTWVAAGPLVAKVAGAAYDVTATLTGYPATPTAVGVPPVARSRELAVAQRRLFQEVDAVTTLYPWEADLVRESASRVSSLVRALENVTSR